MNSNHRNASKPQPRRAGRVYNHDIIASSEEKCRSRLLSKLQELKDEQVLKESLVPNSSAFEVLEFYGDSVLYHTISQYIMTTRRFMDPHLMTQLRMSCIRNSNLADVFDHLRFAVLLRESLVPSAPKAKADVVEAIIGELAENDEDSAILNELTAYIAYIGEKSWFQSQALLHVEKKQVLYAPTVSTPSASQASSSIGLPPVSKHQQSRRRSDEKKSSPPQAPSPIYEKILVKSKADKASMKSHVLPPTFVPVPKPEKTESVDKAEVSFPTKSDEARKPLFYVPAAKASASGPGTSAPVVGVKKVPSPAGDAREVSGLLSDDPSIVIKSFVRPAPQPGRPLPFQSTLMFDQALENQRTGVTKILRRPLVVADAPQRVSYEYH